MPATGCVRPHQSWPKANARLTLARPSPVDVLMLPTKTPIDWRAPIVSAKVPAAASSTSSSGRIAASRVVSFIVGPFLVVGFFEQPDGLVEQAVQLRDALDAE